MNLVDLQGKYVLPGLINTHVHLAVGKPDPLLARAYLRRELFSGVTTVRDMADDVRLVGELKREAASGEIDSPDIFYVALVAGPDFFSDPRSSDASVGYPPGGAPWMRAVAADSDLRQVIAEARGTGASAIKIYADLPATLVSGITAEAHRQGLLVWAHAAVFPASPLEVIRSNVDVVSHSDLLAYQLFPEMPARYASAPALPAQADYDDPRMAVVYREMKERGIILDATVDLAYRYPSMKLSPSASSAIAAAAHRHGVMISTGTDDDPDWNNPDSALIDEIERLAQSAGFSPMEALHAATVVSARAAGRQNVVGKLQPGYAADFVVLKENPLENLENLRSVETVVKHGVAHLRKDYVPFRPAARH
ncbi:MAG TPA: amidohydrolase family protein [Dongiaceae bacterium]|nr:amidohydrolase family protein [Dongiaceae bacterium]